MISVPKDRVFRQLYPIDGVSTCVCYVHDEFKECTDTRKFGPFLEFYSVNKDNFTVAAEYGQVGLACRRTMHPSFSVISNQRGLSGTHCLSSAMPHNRSVHPPSHHVSLSQPCLPVANIGPTKILPYLFLGSQGDAHCEETMMQNGITYVLNVSISGTRPTFIQDGHFLRIPINDSYSDKLSPFFNDAFQFLDKVREANGCVLVHCLAGVSRSPTLAIAYIMHSFGMLMDEAYRYVKDKRPTISPNFNFLGQLLEYERQLCTWEPAETSIIHGESVAKKQRTENVCDPVTNESSQCATLGFALVTTTSYPLTLSSPTTALARLNVNQLSPLREQPSPCATDVTSDILLNSHTPSVTTSGLTLRLGPKHCAMKRPLSDPSSTSGYGIDEEGHGGSSMKRHLMRPNSISFASVVKAGVSGKVTLGTVVADGSRSFVLSSPFGEESSPLHPEEPLQLTEGRVREDETRCRGSKSQVYRENLSPTKEERISKPPRHDMSKTLTNHPVNIIKSCETLTSRPSKLFLPGCNLTPQNQLCGTLTPVDSQLPTSTLAMLESSMPVGTLTAVKSKQLGGTLTLRPADLPIILNRETGYTEHPQVVMARKSRSLEDILNCPIPYEAKKFR